MDTRDTQMMSNTEKNQNSSTEQKPIKKLTIEDMKRIGQQEIEMYERVDKLYP